MWQRLERMLLPKGVKGKMVVLRIGTHPSSRIGCWLTVANTVYCATYLHLKSTWSTSVVFTYTIKIITGHMAS